MGRHSGWLQIDTAVPPLDNKTASVSSLSETVKEVFEAGILTFRENTKESPHWLSNTALT